MLAAIKRLYLFVIAVFHKPPVNHPSTIRQSAAITQPPPAVEAPPLPPPPGPPAPDVVPLLAMDIIPPPQPRPKWAKPQGLEQRAPRVPRQPNLDKPKRERAPRPATRPDDDPERWGQFYFRDAILDQLDVYFMYLKRMKHKDRDAYDLHRQLGIQIMPRSAINAFDQWRTGGDEMALSAWWRENRPAFGAIAYGVDRDSLYDESVTVLDAPPEYFADRPPCDLGKARRQALHTRGETITLRSGESVITGVLWVPKFLYFQKYKNPPAEVERIAEGDVYKMTVYWDRLDNRVRTHTHNKGGIPQSYALCVDGAGQVRVLRMLLDTSEHLRERRGINRGHHFTIPNKRWRIPSHVLWWATGRLDFSPEEYLRRCFLEAALMYEHSALGSMIRVEASKGKLSATFGVDVKRTSYFFKDRDVTAEALTAAGTRIPIFHSVRPHTRNTNHGEVGVRMHFRGLREFGWAGYRVKITVPGRDHRPLPEFNVGAVDRTQGTVGMKELGARLASMIREGKGACKANAR